MSYLSYSNSEYLNVQGCKDIRTKMLTAALLIIITCRQPKVPPTGVISKKLWYSHTMKSHPSTKKNKVNLYCHNTATILHCWIFKKKGKKQQCRTLKFHETHIYGLISMWLEKRSYGNRVWSFTFFFVYLVSFEFFHVSITR